jgi:hypothetical protein
MAIRTVIPDGQSGVGDIPPIVTIDGKMSQNTAAYISGALRGLIAKLNGQLSFGTGISSTRAGNFDAQYIDVYTPGADAEFAVPHGLGRKPIGYDVVRQDKACNVYDSSGGSWGFDTLFLKCDVANCTIKLRVY